MLNEGRISNNKFILSNFFWGSVLLIAAISFIDNVFPPIDLLMFLAFPYFVIAIVLEISVIAKEIEFSGQPVRVRVAWLGIVGCWLCFISQLDNNSTTWLLILGLICLAAEFKNMKRFGGYLFFRRYFLSIVVGFVFPILVILVLSDLTGSRSKRR